MAQLDLGPTEQVDSGGGPIKVDKDSAVGYVDWNEDGLEDLILANGYGPERVKVRVFLNVGSATAPSFAGYFFVQAGGQDLAEPGSG